MRYTEPWVEVVDIQQRVVFETELRQEVATYAAAFYSQAVLIARRIDRDDFLFDTKNAQWPYAIVHLTFSGKPESQPYPISSLFKSIDAVEAKLAQDVISY